MNIRHSLYKNQQSVKMVAKKLMLRLRPHSVGMKWTCGPEQHPGFDVKIWKDESSNELEFEVTTPESRSRPSESWRPRPSESWRQRLEEEVHTHGWREIGAPCSSKVSYSDAVRQHPQARKPVESHQRSHPVGIPESKPSAQVLKEATSRTIRRRENEGEPRFPENTKWKKMKKAKKLGKLGKWIQVVPPKTPQNAVSIRNHLKQHSPDPSKIASPFPRQPRNKSDVIKNAQVITLEPRVIVKRANKKEYLKSLDKNIMVSGKPVPKASVSGVEVKKHVANPKIIAPAEPRIPKVSRKIMNDDEWTVVSYPVKRINLEQVHEAQSQETVKKFSETKDKNKKSGQTKNRFSVLEDLDEEKPATTDPRMSIAPAQSNIGKKKEEEKLKKQTKSHFQKKFQNPITPKQYWKKLNNFQKTEGYRKVERITGGGKTQTTQDILRSKKLGMKETDDKDTIICWMPFPTNELVRCYYKTCNTSTKAGHGSADVKYIADHIRRVHGKRVKWAYECVEENCGAKSPEDVTSARATKWVKEHMLEVHGRQVESRIRPGKCLADTTMEVLESTAPSLARPPKPTKEKEKVKEKEMTSSQETPEKLELKIRTRSVTKALSVLKASAMKKEEPEVKDVSNKNPKLAGIFKNVAQGNGPRRSLANVLKKDQVSSPSSDGLGALKPISNAERVKLAREMSSRQSRLSIQGRQSLSTPKENAKVVSEGEKPKGEATPDTEEKEEVVISDTDTTVQLESDEDDGHNRTVVYEDWEPVYRKFNTWCLDHETTAEAWLCDEAVEWYIKGLCAKNDKFMLIDPVHWLMWDREGTENILRRLWSNKISLFPICEGDHWVLVVISSTQIWYLNSMGKEPHGKVKQFIKETKRVRAWYEVPIPLQKDFVNCGVHVCLMARSITTGVYWFDQSEVQSFRSAFKQDLKERRYHLYSERHVRQKAVTQSNKEEKFYQSSTESTPEKPDPVETIVEVEEVIPKEDSEVRILEVEKVAEIPKLVDLKVTAPLKVENRVHVNQAQSQMKPREKPTAQMDKKRKVPSGNPDTVVKTVRQWFEREFQSYVNDGRSFQRLEWLTGMLTAAVQKASAGDEEMVEKMKKRSPPLEMKKGEMATQTEVKKKDIRSNGSAPKPPTHTALLKNVYWENRSKTFNSIVGEEFKQCDIPIDKLEEFFKKTTSVTNVPQKKLDEVTSRLPKLEIGEWMEDEFTASEVMNALKKTKDTKPGVDGLRYHHLSWFDPDCKMLTLIYNECRKHRKIPSQWKEAETILLYKGGDESKPDNWRPISLMPTIYKLYSSLWNRRIRSVNGVMSKCQRGFQEREGCNESIAILRSAIDVAKGRKSELAVAWLDLTNAFGSVPHELIESTLTAYGFPDTVVQVVKDMYDGASIRVKNRTAKSDPIKINSGVKQGDPISPTLFNMCLESVIRKHLETASGHKCLGTKIKILAFADDMAIISDHKGQLQKELTEMDEDCSPLNLLFKPAKCASLILQKGVVQRRAEIKLKGEPIRNLHDDGTYKYLGVQTGAATRVSELDLMKKVMQELDKVTRSDLTQPQKLDCVKCFILPKLTYMYGNSIPKITELKVFANLVMRSVKIMHSIPVRGSPLEYVQLPVAKGGLGVACPKITAMITFLTSIMKKLWSSDNYIRRLYTEYLKTVVEAETRNKQVSTQDLAEYLSNEVAASKKAFGFNCFTRVREVCKGLTKIQNAPLHQLRFVEEGGELAIKVQATETSKVKTYTELHLKKLQQLLKGDINAALLHRFLTQKQVKSEVVQVIQQHPGSNSFVRKGGNVSMASHRFIHKARLNLLPCNYNTYDSKSPKGCRRCQDERETQWHILQNCRYSLGGPITDRHNAVLYKVVQMIEGGTKKGWDIRVDHEYPQFSQLRPDIFMESPDKMEVIIADVTVPYEHGLRAMERAWRMKVEKYEAGFQLLRDQGRKVTVLPIVLGSLGTWWTPTSKCLEELGISKNAIRRVIPELCSTVMEHSKNIYWRHIFGDAYTMVPIRYGFEKPTGEWRKTRAGSAPNSSQN